MPRPSLNRSRFNSTLPKDLLAALDKAAASAGKTRSDLIEGAVRAMLGETIAVARSKTTRK